jgi:protein-S-isoprenylcysteine O-methyltransferase Ste14
MLPENTFDYVFIVGFVGGCVIRSIWIAPVMRERRKKASRTADDRRVPLERLLVLLVSAGMYILPLVYLTTSWLDFADYGLPGRAATTLGVLGALVFVCGLWLLWRSHADLGRNWSLKLEIQKEHSLVTGGVYRHIRHPMYAAYWLGALAQALLLSNWIAGPAFLVTFVPLYLRRVPHEEQMMLDNFGEEYRSYVGRTGRVIPRLGKS